MHLRALHNAFTQTFAMSWDMTVPQMPLRLPTTPREVFLALGDVDARQAPKAYTYIANTVTGASRWSSTHRFEDHIRVPLPCDRCSTGFTVWWQTAAAGMCTLGWWDIMHLFARKYILTMQSTPDLMKHYLGINVILKAEKTHGEAGKARTA